jgi:hypothetical protein
MTLPNHLRCQKVQKGEAGSEVAIPIHWTDDSYQGTLRVSSGSANVNALVWAVR